MFVFWIKELPFGHNTVILVFIQLTTDIYIMWIQDGGHQSMKLSMLCVLDEALLLLLLLLLLQNTQD